MGHWTINGTYKFTKEEREEAHKNGVSTHLLYQRVNMSDWLPEKAINTPPRQRGKYAEAVKIAKSNGISPQTFSQRVNRQRWTIEEASTVPIGTYRGRRRVKYTKEQYEQAKANGISKSTLSNRVNKLGWAVERAINEKPSYSRRKKMTNTEFMREYFISKVFETLSIFDICISDVSVQDFSNSCNITVIFEYGNETIGLVRAIRPEPNDEEIDFVLKDICITVMNTLYKVVTKWYTNATAQ